MLPFTFPYTHPQWLGVYPPERNPPKLSIKQELPDFVIPTNRQPRKSTSKEADQELTNVTHFPFQVHTRSGKVFNPLREIHLSIKQEFPDFVIPTNRQPRKSTSKEGDQETTEGPVHNSSGR